jgi:CRP-like cAMP-binding protein
MLEIKEVLKNHPFLEELDDKYLDTLSGCATNAVFHEGQYLFKEGESADKFFLIKQGKCAVEVRSPDRGTIRIQTAGPGDVLGWSWLVFPHKWHFDAIAIEDCRVISMDGKCMREKCENDHDFGYEMFKRITNVLEKRLNATRLQLMDFYSIKKGVEI